MNEVEAVARAIKSASCPGREGPFGGYDYGHNEAFYGPPPEGGRYVIRDFRDPSSPDWGAWLHQTNDRDEHESMFAKMTDDHVAQAAIAALDAARGDAEPVAWMPIETAPKDGTFIQLFEPLAQPPVSVGCYDDEAGWLIAEADFMPSKCQPRCWAPLLPRPDIAPDAKSKSMVVSDKDYADRIAELEAEVERLRRNVRGWVEWHRRCDADDDCTYLNDNAWCDAEALASTGMGLLARTALGASHDV